MCGGTVACRLSERQNIIVQIAEKNQNTFFLSPHTSIKLFLLSPVQLGLKLTNFLYLYDNT